jgi:anti-sigma B factor antagonist
MLVEPVVRVELAEPGLSFAVLEGEYDAASAGSLRETLSTVLARGESIVVDLSGATFVDSSVLAVLVGTRAAAREVGVGFALLLSDTTAPAVRRAFEVTGLLRSFWVASNRERALDAMRRSAQPV